MDTLKILQKLYRLGQILTGFSLSICKSIKEVPGFAAGTFDRDAAFRALLGEKE